MGNNYGNRSGNDRNRQFDDRDEGNRWGDRGDHRGHEHGMHGGDRSIDRGGMGQSGYSAGRVQGDRSLDYQTRNQSWQPGTYQERQAFGTDDRFTGRGGDDYLRSDRNERGRGGYQADQLGARNAGMGRGMEAERIGQRDSYGDRNYDQSFGRQGGDNERNLGTYDHRGDNRSFQSRDYGASESERGAWASQNQGYNTGGFNNQTGFSMGMPGQNQGQGVHRGKGPKGYTRSDERIKETVCEALTDDHHIDASGIDVEVKGGEVTLSGMVPDRRTKRLAEDLVEGLSGVKDVTNQLKVNDEERQRLGQASQSGNRDSYTAVGHETEPRSGNGKTDDKKARA